VNGLFALGKDGISGLLAAVTSTDPKVRSAAANRLGRSGDARADSALALALSDTAIWKTASVALVRLHQGHLADALAYLKAERTVRVYYGLIRLGAPGTEGSLSTALMQFGDEEMGEFYLNSGNDQLEAKAEEWAAANGYEVIPGVTPLVPTWGTGLDGE
jgi:HEAT repeat protein